MTDLTEFQIHIMRHALGLTRRKESYRNYYIAQETSRAARAWRELISFGFATVDSHLDTGMALYRVTPAGLAALSVPSQQGNTP